LTPARIGFIGAGGIAGRHLNNLLGFTDVQVVAFADPALERAQDAAQRVSGTAYADYREMLDRERLDALYICTPPFAHGAPEFAAVEHRLPFFVEKPLATDLATAEHVAQAVEVQSLVTAVGYHWRYLDTTDEVRERLERHPPRLVIGYWLDATPPPSWWIVEQQSGGQMVEQSTHIFDLVRLLAGEVAEVYAIGSRVNRAAFPSSDVCDVSTAALRFAGGAVGSISSTCLLRWPHRIGLHLFAEGMAIELGEFELMVDVGQGRPVRQAAGDPFVREDRDFIDAVQGKENRVRAPYHEALRTHRLATAAARSAREGRPISLQPQEAYG
jgi:predicted dehydrogenase